MVSEPLEAVEKARVVADEAVMVALEQVAPELAPEFLEKGIVLTGGGSLLSRLDQMLAEETGLSVIVSENALTCMASGARLLLEDSNLRATMIAA